MSRLVDAATAAEAARFARRIAAAAAAFARTLIKLEHPDREAVQRLAESAAAQARLASELAAHLAAQADQDPDLEADDWVPRPTYCRPHRAAGRQRVRAPRGARHPYRIASTRRAAGGA